jgi:hypothetical protein
MTMMTRTCAIGFLAILLPVAANAQTTGNPFTNPFANPFPNPFPSPFSTPSPPTEQTAPKPETVTRRPAKRVVVRISDRTRSERIGYKKVSSLVEFPPFFPGIGALYVQPENIPNGPYRAFDRRGRLNSTIYMLPIEDLENRKKFDLAGLAGKGDHVTFYFNSGHPGLDKPHYHVHVWHVSKAGEERVAK